MKIPGGLIRKLGLTLIMFSAVIAVLYGLFLESKARSFQFFGELVDRVETPEKVIALTFDDGPTEFTDEVLEILKSQDVKGTFFVIGSEVEKRPEMARKMVEEGHQLGNHTYSHTRMLLKSQDFIREEITKTNDLIRAAGFEGEITFRPPTGKKFLGLPWYLSQNNIKTIMWDVEPDTYYLGDSEGIAKYVLRNAREGSIILFHPHCITKCKADREALPEIISGLKARGFRFVTVSELLNLRAK